VDDFAALLLPDCDLTLAPIEKRDLEIANARRTDSGVNYGLVDQSVVEHLRKDPPVSSRRRSLDLHMVVGTSHISA
jgi:hypothetical protein